MASALLLTMLKTDLGILQSTAYDTRLGQYLDAAEQEIIKEGALNFNASSNLDDAQLLVMYAAWLWRKRDTMEAMPRMVRYALNNRVFKGET